MTRTTILGVLELIKTTPMTKNDYSCWKVFNKKTRQFYGVVVMQADHWNKRFGGHQAFSSKVWIFYDRNTNYTISTTRYGAIKHLIEKLLENNASMAKLADARDLKSLGI